MGGYTIEKLFDGALSRQEVERKIDDLKSDAAHEYGHGRDISGIWFQFITDPHLTTQEQVREKYENIEKNSGIIIRVKKSDIDRSQRGPLKPFEDAVNAAHQALKAQCPEILKRLKAQTSKTRGCKRCESAVAVKYLATSYKRYPDSGETIACPVCHQPDFVFTQTDLAKREALTKAAEKAQAALQAAEADLAAKHATPIWMAFGCARE